MNSSFEKQILGIVCSVFDAYSSVLFLPEETGQKHYLAAYFSLGDNIPEDTVILPGKGLVGWIIHNRQAMIVDDFDQHQSYLGYYGSQTDEKIKAFMGFPIPSGGVICVDSKRKYSFTDKDCKILQLFAELLGKSRSKPEEDAGQDSPRYFAELGVIQELRFRFRRWPEFLRNFLRVVARAMCFDYCAFATLQEDGETWCLESESAPLLLVNGPLCQPLGSGITGWVFRNEQPVFAEVNNSATALFGKVEDIPDFPTAVCLPVMVNRTCRGVLCAANTEPRPIDDAMRSFASMAVDHLSLFLENLYLKNRLAGYLRKARLQHEGARPFDPDRPPRQDEGDTGA